MQRQTRCSPPMSPTVSAAIQKGKATRQICHYRTEIRRQGVQSAELRA
jgi:hypothetical protein